MLRGGLLSLVAASFIAGSSAFSSPAGLGALHKASHGRSSSAMRPASSLRVASSLGLSMKADAPVQVDFSVCKGDTDTTMGASLVRCAAFWGPGDKPGFMENSMYLFQGCCANQEQGTELLVAKVADPWGEDVLTRIARAPCLRNPVDDMALQLLEQKGRDKAEVVDEWKKGCVDRMLVVGAVDIGTYPFDNCKAWKGKKDVYLGDMAIHPYFQGIGIGTKLLDQAISHAKAKKYEQIHLHAPSDNAKLFSAKGFKEAAEDEATKELSENLSKTAPDYKLMTLKL